MRLDKGEFVKSKLNAGLDLLKMIAIFSVIVIHMPLVDADARATVLRYLPYGTACFALLAGWFMFGLVSASEEISSFKEWVRKRCERLLLPYIVWTTIHLSLTFGLAIIKGEFIWPTALDWYHYIFCGHGATQLWFVISLFYAQMAVAMLVLCRCSPLLLFLTGIASVYGMTFMTNDCAFRNHIFMLGLVSLGLAARLIAESEKVKSLFSCNSVKVLMAIGCGAVIVLSYSVSFGPLWLLPVFAWCLMFGMLGKLIQSPTPSHPNSSISPLLHLSMGIYLTHWLVTRAVIKPLMPLVIRFCGDGIGVILAMSLLVLVLSGILTYLLRAHKWLVG